MQIGIIEDGSILRENIETFFSIYPDIEVNISASSIESFLTQSLQVNQEPYIVFIDVGLPGISGIEGISKVRERFQNTHIVMISGTCNEESIWEAVKAGANGYLLKPLSLKRLVEQIDIIKNNGALISPEVASMLFSKINQKPPERKVKAEELLSRRELDVMDYLLKGMSYKEIADKLYISYTTVNDHVKKIYHKLGINSKGELLALFIN